VANSEKHVLVYLARHGTTDLNLHHAFRGPVDAPLDKAGTRDANTLAYYFEPIDVSLIGHSGRKRTRDTAKLIADRKGYPHQELLDNPGLQAWNVGYLGGKPKNGENLKVIDYHTANPDVPIPEGESLNHFKVRVRPLLIDAIDLGARSGMPVLLIIHSSIIHEAGTMIAGCHTRALVEPGGVAAIYIQNGKLDVEPIFKPRLDKQTEIT
jgi:broad specificity phosphatase PhoE